MTFISYAQNLEDVLLWRIFKKIGGGSYIDIGAVRTTEHSVTKDFYERGWCGVNIKTNPLFFEQLQIERPRDISLKLAINNILAL